MFLVLFLAGVGLWILMLMRYGLFTKAKAAEKLETEGGGGFNPRI